MEHGNISLVMDALKERGVLREHAPHLVRDLAFIVPSYEWWEAPFYGIGLRLYDLLAGKCGFGPSRNLSRDETLYRIPTLKTEGLRGGIIYYDGQFDDARLLINLAQTAFEQGATLVNYCPAVAFTRGGDGFIAGAVARDEAAAEAITLLNPLQEQIVALSASDVELAVKLDGYPRNLSVHCGGIVIVPDRMDRLLSVRHSAKPGRTIWTSRR